MREELAPEKTSSSSKGRSSERPYTAMYLSGLRIGFTSNDLRTMPLPRLIQFIDEYNAMNTPSKNEDENKPRKATQADIDSMLA